MIKKYDNDDKGYLVSKELRTFLHEVFDFNFKHYVDMNQYLLIKQIIDPNRTGKYQNDEILAFCEAEDGLVEYLNKDVTP